MRKRKSLDSRTSVSGQGPHPRAGPAHGLRAVALVELQRTRARETHQCESIEGLYERTDRISQASDLPPREINGGALDVTTLVGMRALGQNERA